LRTFLLFFDRPTPPAVKTTTCFVFPDDDMVTTRMMGGVFVAVLTVSGSHEDRLYVCEIGHFLPL
jgi:hypothetical protein